MQQHQCNAVPHTQYLLPLRMCYVYTTGLDLSWQACTQINTKKHSRKTFVYVLPFFGNGGHRCLRLTVKTVYVTTKLTPRITPDMYRMLRIRKHKPRYIFP